MRTIAMAMAVLIGASGVATAAVKTQVVEYQQGGTTLEGYLAWDDSPQSKRPGVLVVHEWTGLGDYAKARARQLAEMGYVAFAADIYGKGVHPRTPQ
jgi:dienelactone hydrolase